MTEPPFETADMAAPITDATNGTGAQGPKRDEESSKRARELGWVQPQSYNYDAKAPTVQVNTVDDAPEVDDEEKVVSVHQSSTWAHDAPKYEWQEEYGDVGPRNVALEKELFQGDHINRAGEKFKKSVASRRAFVLFC